MTTPTHLAAVEAMARAISQPLGNMQGGCFNPHDDPRGECADLDCYCARVGKHCATAALTALTTLHPGIGAVLRGEAVIVPTAAEMTDAQAEAVAAMANCCGGVAYDTYRVALEASPYAPTAGGAA